MSAAGKQSAPPASPTAPPSDNGRAGKHTAEFFYRPESDADGAFLAVGKLGAARVQFALRAVSHSPRRCCTASPAVLHAASDPYGSRLRSLLLPVCSAAIALYIGVHAAPIVGSGSLTHASRLLGAREAFLQRSGAERLALLVRSSEALAVAAVEAGAPRQLLSLLERSADASVLAAVAAALAELAATPPGAHALRAAPELLSLQALAAAPPQPGEAPAAAAARASAREALVQLGLLTSFAAEVRR